ncbi:MAG: OmpA family protein [Paracoccaceae bacterium]
MTLRTKPVLLLTAGVLTLGACTAPPAGNDPYQRTRSGAFLGGAVGAVTGALVSDNDLEGALIGGAIGAASGAVVGNILDQQAAELRRDMGNDRVQIRNTGEALVVQLPSDILFDVDSAAVRPDLRADLAALAGNLKRFPNSRVEVVGHTDSDGSAEYNYDLSVRRADSVKTVLVNNGIMPARVIATGKGEDEPVATNQTDAGKALNRRVEIIIRPTQQRR